MKRKVYGTVLCAVLAAVGIGAAMWSAGAEEAVKSTVQASPSPTPKVAPSAKELNEIRDFTSLESRQLGEYWYNDDPSTYLGASDYMRAVTKVMTPQQCFELNKDILDAAYPNYNGLGRYAEDTVKLHRNAEGAPVTESEKPVKFTAETGTSTRISSPSGLPIDCTLTDVRVSDRLEYGLKPEDDTFIPWTADETDESAYPWVRQCALDEDGVLTAPEHYAFVYLTVHANFSGKFDAALFRMESANLYWYNENGYMLDGALPAQNKTELIDGLAQVPYNNEDVNWATDVVLNNNEPRDLLYVFLVPDQYVYPLTDEASARRDGVHSNYDIVKYYSIGTYEEEDLTYTFEVVNYGSRTAKLDLTEYVKAYFAEHK